MAQAIRIEYAGVVYHAMARGDRGRPIFQDDKDRPRFLETLAEACDETNGSSFHVDILRPHLATVNSPSHAPCSHSDSVKALAEEGENTGWRIRACGLMGNHYHRLFGLAGGRRKGLPKHAGKNAAGVGAGAADDGLVALAE